MLQCDWILHSCTVSHKRRIVSLEERMACDDTPVKRISCTKLLGLYMDQHLTWKTTVHQLQETVTTLKSSPLSCENTPGGELSPL